MDNIYFTASIRGGKPDVEVYPNIIKHPRKCGNAHLLGGIRKARLLSQEEVKR